MSTVLWTITALSILASVCGAMRQSSAAGHSASVARAAEVVVSLDGAWRIEPAGGPERAIQVPGFWDRVPEIRDAHEAVYRRAFDVPESFRGKRVSLRFDAVGDSADVSVNGQHAGGHVGADLPFEVDITGLVAVPSAGNRLEVTVRDDSFYSAPKPSQDWRNRKSWIPRGMGCNNRKGLYQSVTLWARPAIAVTDVRIQTSVRRHQITVTYEIHNGTKETVHALIGAEAVPFATGKTEPEAPPLSSAPGSVPLVSADAVATLRPLPVDLPGYVTTTVAAPMLTGNLSSPLAGITLWQPDHPTLYSLHTTLSDDSGKPLHSLDTRFGFREVWFDGIHFYLNGIRCNLRGESPAYSEKADMMATREAAAEMVRKYQKANVNVLRFHSMPAPPHVLDVCDELGMLVIDESAIYASWQMLMPEHPQWMENCREHLTRWVRRDRNHPAVVLWSAENEGLNVGWLTPAMLAEFRRIIDASDGSRPVVFDGDGTAFGASPASVKHYVKTIDDLKERGGRSSGYARDLRSDIYWATAFKQDVPLGCGEFLFPYEPGLRDKEREVICMMGLQTRGYRLADWFDIRPYNPSYCGFLRPEGVRPGYEQAYDVIGKSFAPIAVFDREYDALGPFPAPPHLKSGEPAARTLIVYNDAFSGTKVEVAWEARMDGSHLAGGRRGLTIPLGSHALLDITFMPRGTGPLQLELTTLKTGKEQFRDLREFIVD